MKSKLQIANLDDINETNTLYVEIYGELLLLSKVEDKIYLTSDICTHEDAELSMGCLKDKKVKCPLHGSWFNLENGKPLNEPATESLRTFDVEIIDNIIYKLDDEK